MTILVRLLGKVFMLAVALLMFAMMVSCGHLAASSGGFAALICALGTAGAALLGIVCLKLFITV